MKFLKSGWAKVKSGWAKEGEGRLARQLALRSVAAYVAHEVNHPLGTIANLAALLSRRVSDRVIRPSELVSHIDAIKVETKRAADVSKNLRVLAGGLHGPRETVYVHALLREAASRLRRRYSKESVNVRVECRNHTLSLQGVPDLLHIALHNLLINGVEALQAAAVEQPCLRLRANYSDDDARVIIDVIDNGPGASQAIRERMFEPLVSDKPGGSGLGLAICRDAVEWHRGKLSYEDGVEQCGACFRISLPKDSSDG